MLGRHHPVWGRVVSARHRDVDRTKHQLGALGASPGARRAPAPEPRRTRGARRGSLWWGARRPRRARAGYAPATRPGPAFTERALWLALVKAAKPDTATFSASAVAGRVSRESSGPRWQVLVSVSGPLLSSHGVLWQPMSQPPTKRTLLVLCPLIRTSGNPGRRRCLGTTLSSRPKGGEVRLLADVVLPMCRALGRTATGPKSE